MRAKEAFNSRNPDETVAYQNVLIERGELGQIAFGLFRAQKRSTVAKEQRRRGYRRQAYSGKAEALDYLDVALRLNADSHGINWGWLRDYKQEFHNMVLYVDLPNFGQCSFHAAVPSSDKVYDGTWCNDRKSETVVIDFCDFAYNGQPVEVGASHLMPFGTFVGMRFGDLEASYIKWLAAWDGLVKWPGIARYIKQKAAEE